MFFFLPQIFALIKIKFCFSKFFSFHSEAEIAANKLLKHWSDLRMQAIDQDIMVISILVAFMLLLHCIAYSKV